MTVPLTSVFPRLISNESFSCVFTNMESKAIFNLSMIDNVCVNENVSFVLRNTSLIRKFYNNSFWLNKIFFLYRAVV